MESRLVHAFVIETMIIHYAYTIDTPGIKLSIWSSLVGNESNGITQ